MSYQPEDIVRAYQQNAEEEDRAEKMRSLRTEIPRTFIEKYLVESDVVLDAGGGNPGSTPSSWHRAAGR